MGTKAHYEKIKAAASSSPSMQYHIMWNIKDALGKDFGHELANNLWDGWESETSYYMEVNTNGMVIWEGMNVVI